MTSADINRMKVTKEIMIPKTKFEASNGFEEDLKITLDEFSLDLKRLINK